MKKNLTLGVLLIGLVASFYGNPTLANVQEPRMYVKIDVDGLSCPFCAYGLEKGIKELEGARDIFISVKEGYVTFSVLKTRQPSEEQLKKVVKDAGFSARGVEFAKKPFETMKAKVDKSR